MKNQIKFGVILGYVNMFVAIIVTLVYTPTMLRLMGQSEYGLYALVASVIGYLSVLDMGFGNSMIRFVSRSKAKTEKKMENKINGLFLFLYSIIGIIALLIGFILFLNVGNIFQALTPSEIAKAKIIMAILVGTVAISFPLSIFDSYVIASEKFTYIKVLNLIQTVAIPLIMLPLLMWGYKSIAMVIVTSTFTIAFHLFNLYYCFSKLNMKISFSFKNIDKTLLKEVLTYSFFIFLNLIVDSLYANTDQVILGAVSGTAAVSVYAIATKISNMNTSFSTNISGLFFPRITKTLEEKDGDKKVSDIFIKVSRIQLYILAMILFGFIIFGKSFILLWIGQDYIDVYYILLILLIPGIVPLTQNIGISILQAKNMHKFRSVIYILIALLNIAVSIPLAIRYAGIGAAIGTAMATFLGQILTMNIYYYKKGKIDIPRYWKHFIKFMLPLTIFSIFVVSFDFILSWIQLIIFGFMFVCLYLVYAYFHTNEQEKQYITNFINKLKRKNKII